MNTRKLIRGLLILHAASEEKDAYDIGAEHDQIYFWGHSMLGEEEVSELKDLGWFHPEKDEDDPYEPGESWSAFV